MKSQSGCLFRFIEEPTAPDDILGHAAIRTALKPDRIGVATGEHAHNRMVFKQLLQAQAIDVCQIDSCRLAGVSEVLSVLLMANKYVKACIGIISAFVNPYSGLAYRSVHMPVVLAFANIPFILGLSRNTRIPLNVTEV